MKTIAEPNLSDPLTLCKWAALFGAIRLIDETARERKVDVKFSDHTYLALLGFIEHKHGRILQANFPNWKRGQRLPALPKTLSQEAPEKPKAAKKRKGKWSRVRIAALLLGGENMVQIGVKTGANFREIKNVLGSLASVPNCRCGRPITHRGMCLNRTGPNPRAIFKSKLANA